MILWGAATAIAGEATYALPGDYARVEITAHPAYLTHTIAALPLYRALGQAGPTVGGKPTDTAPLGYLDTILGPFLPAADGLYILLNAGVTANLYIGYEMSDTIQPAVSLKRTNVINLPDQTPVYITWEEVIENNFLLWSSGDPTKITIKQAGLYLISIQTLWLTTAGKMVAVNLTKNAATNIFNLYHIGTTVNLWDPGYSDLLQVRLIVGDYIRAVVAQKSGATTNELAGSAIQICRISA